MKSCCRQSLLFVVFCLLSLTMVNAAEAELKAQTQLVPNTWGTVFRVITPHEIIFTTRNPVEQKISTQFESVVSFFGNTQHLRSVYFDKATSLITIVSNQKVEFSSALNR